MGVPQAGGLDILIVDIYIFSFVKLFNCPPFSQVRIYTKPKGQLPDYEQPVILDNKKYDKNKWMFFFNLRNFRLSFYPNPNA